MAKPLTILIRPSTDAAWIGGAIYFRNLINSINAAAKERQQRVLIKIVYDDRDGIPTFDSTFGDQYERVFASDFNPADAEPAERRPLRERDVEPFVIRRALRFRLMLRHHEADFLFPFLPQIEDEITSCPFASWIPDLQHVFLPEFFSENDLEVRDRKYSRACEFSDAIVLSSESAKEDFIGKYGKPRGNIDVLRFYTLPDSRWYDESVDRVRAKYDIPEVYFMVCNQLWAHKNHAAVIEALRLLKESGKEASVVFTGGLTDTRKSGMIDSFLQQVAEAGVWGQCRILGMLPRIEQIQLIRGCSAVIQPSLFEGWSTVVEDCRTLGKDLLLSDLRVHREQDVPGSRFWNPKDSRELAVLIEETLERPAGYSEKRETEARMKAENMALDCGQRFLSLVERTAKRDSIGLPTA